MVTAEGLIRSTAGEDFKQFFPRGMEKCLARLGGSLPYWATKKRSVPQLVRHCPRWTVGAFREGIHWVPLRPAEATAIAVVGSGEDILEAMKHQRFKLRTIVFG